MKDRFFKHFAPFVILVAAIFPLNGCSDFKNIRVTSCELISIKPDGLRAADAVLAITVDNPAAGFSIRDLEGFVMRNRTDTSAVFNGGPVDVEGKMLKTYYVPCHASLTPNVSLLELLALLDTGNFSQYTADISATVSLRGGAGRKLEYKNLSLADIVKQTE